MMICSLHLLLILDYLLLYKAEKPSVCLSVHLHFFLVTLITLSCVHWSKPDLLETIAMSSGISKFILVSFQELSSFSSEALKTPMSAIIKKGRWIESWWGHFFVNVVTFSCLTAIMLLTRWSRHGSTQDLVLCYSCGLWQEQVSFMSVSAFGCGHECLKGTGVIPFWLAWICKGFQLWLSTSHLAIL